MFDALLKEGWTRSGPRRSRLSFKRGGFCLILTCPLHLRRDDSQLYVRCSAFADMNSFSSVFKRTKEVGILPCAHLDFFPREHAVVAGRQTFDMEMAIRVSRCRAIEIETISSRRIRNENDGDVSPPNDDTGV